MSTRDQSKSNNSEDKGEALRGGEKKDGVIKEDQVQHEEHQSGLNKSDDTKSGPHQH